MSSTAVAPKKNPADDNKLALMELMSKQKPQLLAALPQNFGVDRFIRSAITLYSTAPGLIECHPMSVLIGAMRAAELGLELSSPLGQAYLVPYFNKHAGYKEAQLQIGYRGLISLAYRSKLVMKVNARVVYEKDHFKYQYGTDEFIEHRPYEGEEDPGKITHFYATIWTTSGGRDFEVMTKAQVDKHRAKFSKQRRGPWDDHYESMGLKTLLRKVCKRAPMLVEANQAAAEDEYVEEGVIPARQNPLTGDVIEGFLVGPDDNGVDEPAEQPAQQPAKSKTERLTERVGAGREPGAEG